MNRYSFYITAIFVCFCIIEMNAEWEESKDRHNNRSPAPLKAMNGNEAEPHRYPFQVFIEIFEENSKFACGGTLLSHRYVLTAAHCIYNTTQVKVILGAHDVTKNESTQIIAYPESLIPHEDYNDEYLDDIGIIKLNKSVTFTNAIKPVRLPTRKSINKDYTWFIATAIGWGYYMFDQSSETFFVSPVLREVQVSIYPIDECLFKLNFLTELQICGMKIGDQPVAEGDSGGPLIVENVQIGVIYLVGKYPKIPISVYMSVGKYLDWIQENSDVTIGCQ